MYYFVYGWGCGGGLGRYRGDRFKVMPKVPLNIHACSPGRFLLGSASESGTRALSIGDSA